MAHIQVFEGAAYRQVDWETARAVKAIGGVVFSKSDRTSRPYIIFMPSSWWEQMVVEGTFTLWVEADGN